MNSLDLLRKQTNDAHIWTNKLVDSIPFDLWNHTPDTIATNIGWQVGHLIISEHYHAILVVAGFRDEIKETIPLREYGRLFAYDSIPREAENKVPMHILRDQLTYMQQKVLETIDSLSESRLAENVEQPFRMRHPVASTNLEAISWNIKHTMWHCGQIATLKRILHGGYDFGLPGQN